MNDEQAETALLLILQGELDRTTEMIRGAILAYDRLFAVGAVVFGAGLTIGFQPNREVVRLLLPLPIVLLLVFGYSLFIEHRGRAGYQHYLEEEVNRLSGRNVLAWEAHVALHAPHLSGNAWTNRFVLPALYTGFLGATWVISIAASYDKLNRYSSWRPVLWASCAISFGLAALAIGGNCSRLIAG